MSEKISRTDGSSLPTKQEIIDFIKDSPRKVGKREIARAFGVRGPNRGALRDLLKEMADEGLIPGGRRGGPGRLPPVTVMVITGVDEDGDLVAEPATWDEDTAPPRARIISGGRPGRRKGPKLAALGVGDRVLARIRRRGRELEASPIHKLGAETGTVVGLYTVVDGEARVEPADKRARSDFLVANGRAGDAEHGELVVATILPDARRHYGMRQVAVRERIGHMDDPRSVSLIAIHNQGIPTEFSQAALDAAEGAQEIDALGNREDLRKIPLITIDPPDARDHDDAVWAEPDPDPKNKNGWHIIVAIADVAHYVRADTALDQAARGRGNSVYFPDRVVPMLPEKLSTTLCSLTPGDVRACMAVHLWIDKDGRAKGHKFVRGLMRSAANLSYRQVQAAMDGDRTGDDDADDLAGTLRDKVLSPLYAAHQALMLARDAREPLELELPERDIHLDPEGRITSVALRERLQAHRLVEDMMIAANVAAAEALEAGKVPCMYRIHEPPGEDKLVALREFLASLGIKLTKGQTLKPSHFNKVLANVAGTPDANVVNEATLRSQSQACYSPVNSGHFGLNLARYAHFTSPIRRYSDLLVHRALIRCLGLGPDGLTDPEIEQFGELGEHISSTERRAVAAEREATDRYMAAFMAERVGAEFPGRISGVTRAGLFVTLDESGADGLVPIRTLGSDYFNHDEGHHALVGERTGETFRLGDQVDVRLAEADPLTGAMRLELLREGGQMPVRKSARKRRGKRR